MKFKELYEAAGITIDNTSKKKGKKKAVLVMGRFQPFTEAHERIAKQAQKINKNLVIGIIKGKKSSADKDKNPFDFKTQKQMAKKVFPGAVVMEFGTGFLPTIMLDIRKAGVEIVGYVAGTDRIAGYEKQLGYFDKFAAEDSEFEKPDVQPIHIKRTDSDTSATKVRNALKDGDEETFKRMTPKALHSEFNKLSKIINK